MPPFVPRKRERSPSPIRPPPSKKRASPKRAKKSVFDDAEALESRIGSAENAKKFFDANDSDEDSELSDVESDELDFEDVPAARQRGPGRVAAESGVEESDDDDDEMEWEDATRNATASSSKGPPKVVQEIGDLSISMNDDGSYVEPLVSAATGRKGPSKRERQARVNAHCLHVQMLLWHNTIRNSWLNDAEVQKTLVDGLGEGVKREVTRWREAMGTLTKQELEAKKAAAAAKGRKSKKGKKSGKEKDVGRDWSYSAEHQEQGVPDLSHGDPLLRLLKVLTAYWRKRFTVTAPGLRKQGHMPLRRLREEIKGWEKDPNDIEMHGERLQSRVEFRRLAKRCEGSRDVGAQLFVALLRGLGLETRLVANLQPVGFGWSKGEDAEPKKAKKNGDVKQTADRLSVEDARSKKAGSVGVKSEMKQAPNDAEPTTPSRKSNRGMKATEPINLDEDDSPLSSAPSDLDDEERTQDDDDLSVVDLDPPIARKPNKKYDRDVAYPNYWTEVLSPVTNKYIPVDPIVLSTIASNEELLQSFEPRGKKADIAKQVICYTTAFNTDGSAKDVTIRYLKKHQLPGKTKGMRMGIEKIPVYNRKGKVKKYEEYDWFRTVMSLYDRPEGKRTIADDLEEQTDLKAFKPNKEEKEVEKESLQWYKQSAEYVLEQHLRREEAIQPGAEPVKNFTAGKGEKAKEHPVFLRSDVLLCKTVESWHKEGRQIKVGEQPVKMVPMRAVTLIRKREMEEAERETGEKLKQGLYSVAQTDWIIPPPIVDGIIPKNAFGNMDVYVPTMVPRGAVHLPLKGSAKICKRLGIDFSEACTGFEFGKQRAVPVLTGVVVADEHEILVRDAWRQEQAEMKRKEDTKRTDAALKWWRKMVMGLRILERMEREYDAADGGRDEVNPFVKRAEREGRKQADFGESAGDGGGGFLLPGDDEQEAKHDNRSHGGGFIASDDDEGNDLEAGGFLVDETPPQEEEGGGFLVAEEPLAAAKAGKNYAPITPVSLQSASKTDDVWEEENGGSKLHSATLTRSNRAAERSVSKRGRPSKAKTSSTPKSVPSSHSTRLKQVTPIADEEDELCETFSGGDADTDAEVPSFGSDDDLQLPKLRTKATSPEVVIISQKAKKSRSNNNGHATRISKRNTGKATPVRSRYFQNGGGTAMDDVEEFDDEVGEATSEEEVIRPRATTTRTRSLRGT